MVILLYCEMEDDGRRSSRKAGLLKWVFSSNRSSPSDSRRKHSGATLPPPRERRPLRSVPLVGPHYRVEPETLVTEFVEKEAQYLGTVTDLPCDFDASDRASLLKIVDEQQTLELLPCQLSYKNDIIISISVHNIKLLRRDGEKLILRMQTHKIAAVGYVRDDNQHLVFLKYASELNAKMCNLAVLCCASKTAAEEICSLTQQVFQLVYTDSTIDFLDKSIMDGAITPKNHSYSTDDSDKKDTVTVSSRDYAPYNLTESTASLTYMPTSKSPGSTNGHATPTAYFERPRQIKRQNTDPLSDVQPGTSATLPQFGSRAVRKHRRSGSSGSSSNNNVTPVTSASTNTLMSPAMTNQTYPPPHKQLQMQDYITVLKEQLTNSELKEFATLLHQFRTGGITIDEFSTRLLEMYTEERKILLLGMRHFIPNTSDLTFFNKFLKDNDVEGAQPAGDAASSWWAQAPRSTPRTVSETEESTASAPAMTGLTTGVSLSSSGSDRASTSLVSNDDSGEWRDVIGNIQRLGFYVGAESSPDAADKKVNGTPPKRNSSGSILELDPPLYQEDVLTPTLVPTVAAVPEGFRDMTETVGRCSGQEQPKEEPDTTSFTKGHEVKGKTKATKRKSKSDAPSSKYMGEPPFTEVSVPETLTVETESKSPMSAKSQPSKPQKEHRKKKKHKKDATTVEAQL